MKRPFTVLFLFALVIAGGWMWQSQQKLPHLTLSPMRAPEDFLPKATAPQPDKALKTTQLVKPVKVAFQHEEMEATSKVKILNEIFQSKNDNDPRLDKEFNELSRTSKEALVRKYEELNAEARNEKGTIVFLLGKNLNSPQDFDFLRQVVREPPCLSLTNCTQSPNQKEAHEEGTVQVTLEYPQIVALKSLEAYLSKNPPSPPVLDVLREAVRSKSPRVRGMAHSLAQRYSH